MSKPTLTVWCLSDGKPGHYNQSKGMLQALALGYTLQTEWIETRLRCKPLRWLLRQLLNRRLAERWVARCHRFTRPAQHPDLILSAGGNTAFLNVALAREMACRNYFLGSLRSLDPNLFSAVFTIEPVAGASNNIVMPLAPVPVDREAQESAGAALQQRHPGTLWTLLIGGATSAYPFADKEWLELAEQMNRLAARHSIRWLVTTSRRTGHEVERQLRDALHPETIAEAVWYGEQPRKVMAAYLGAGERIFCTEDSLSMLTEAVSSGRPVIALYPERCRPTFHYREAIRRLQVRGWIARLPVDAIEVPNLASPDSQMGDPHQELWRLIEKFEAQAGGG